MRKIIFLLVVLVCSIGASAQTQGALEAFDKKGVEVGACPLKHTSVKADVSGFLARVTVTQEFENNFAQAIEAVYTFPLSQNSAVDSMTMLVGARTIHGKILKREEAREIYEAAKNEGKTASLLDQERPNIFTQAVANILPNEKITITISYVETLKYEDGSYEFVFPMTVAPRYIPNSVKAEDANKIAPPVAASRAGHDISIEVVLDAGVPVEAIRSNSHEIETANLGSSSANVKLKDETTIPNKDFVLRYDVSGKRIEDAILTHRDERGGFFTLILQPPDTFRNEDVTPKEIVFVLDTSGSMSGFPIEKAKEAMKLSLDNLYPNDTFNLITFAGDTHILFDAPVLATQANLEKAKNFLESRSGGGGTEMMTAIKAALEPSDAQGHVRIVCFMTDGEIGNDLEVISEVQKHPNARVFSFGIGQSVNRFLLDKIAEEGRGEAEFVALEDDGSKAAKRFYERVRTPLLTDVSIDWNGLPVADVYPNRIADLFSAKPVIVHGRYTKAASGTIKLKGKIGGIETTREIAVVFPETESRNDVLATLWARQRIDDLMKQDYQGIQNGNAKPEVQKTIANIGLEYHLLTQFTSFVAVEDIIKTQGGKPVKVEVPVEFPAGMNRATTLGDTVDVVAGSANSLPINGRRVSNLYTVSAGRRNVRAKSSGRSSGKGSGTGSGSGNGNGSVNPAMPSGAVFSSQLILTPPPQKISAGVLNGKATSLPRPAYPAAARAVRASGAVAVQITTDESGKVISATAVSGHPLLRAAAEKAANSAKFAPTLLSGKSVRIVGTIVYNFSDPANAGAVNVAVGETRLPTDEENVALSPENLRAKLLAEKLHGWLFAVVERLQKGETAPTANESKFVKDGKAEIQIKLSIKTLEVVKKLESLGLEVGNEKDKNSIGGKISVEKLANLAEIAEVQYILPQIN
ncbi:MAG: VIT and VWA domain-containing protein [Acidobacteriota bacterium]|nr:VIT and VWA domain-containing protein [Acidobacteriota bacterium]